MKVAITGADGFLGWHLRVRLHAVLPTADVVGITRNVWSDPRLLRESLAGADVVVHLAGINRDTPDAVERGNANLAQRLVDALDEVGIAPAIIYSNSVHAGADSPYGRGKRQAEEILGEWADNRGSAFVDVVFQNLFGEGGRPDYNSFVATFCHRLATGATPMIDVDRPVELIHAQDAAELIVSRLSGPMKSEVVSTSGHTASVGEVLATLEELSATYATGRLPALDDRFAVQLFNTYRSYLYPDWFPRPLDVKTDPRGSFVEVVQSVGGAGQTSFSTTVPGVTRGNHFHLRKIERFSVLRGSATIAIRPVMGSVTSMFEVSGAEPSFVDMPTLHTHNIINTGADELLTMFWINELFDPQDADTYPEPVT